jgi:KDO2-lipid IV(A) lauroyltransferase
VADRTPLQRKLIRWFVDPPLAVCAFLLYGLLRIMPVDAASAFGGWLLRTVGPWTRADAVARRNLERAFPDRSRAEIDRIRCAVWDNFGRVMGEWPHLNRLYRSGFGNRVEIAGREHIEHARKAGGPIMVITGHHGNWELVGAVCAALGAPLTVIYRPAQNPTVNYLVLWARRHFTGGLLPKGKEAAVGALALLREGGNLGVLIDQKLNEGVPVPFFGRDAMTSPVAARLAVGFRCPVLPVRAERTAGARYRVTIYPPMDIPDSGDRKQDQEAALLAMNRMLEDWVRERPEQWFWVHKRWPD